MTEREYVEFLRWRASSYVETLDNAGCKTKPSIKTVEAWNSWDNARAKISPFTLISMCDAWLERDAGKSASVTHNGACVSPSATTLHASGNSLVERLLENAADHRSLAYDCDCAPEQTVNWQHALDDEEAAARIKDLEDTLDLRDAATKGLCIAIHGEARPEASIYSLTLDADAQRKRIASLERALKLIASGMLGDRVLSELELSGIASAALEAEKAFWLGEGRRFSLGQRVRKIKGSSWQGRIVGVYSTDLTPVGYAVESEREPGSVQIYPEAALEAVDSHG